MAQAPAGAFLKPGNLGVDLAGVEVVKDRLDLIRCEVLIVYSPICPDARRLKRSADRDVLAQAQARAFLRQVATRRRGRADWGCGPDL